MQLDHERDPFYLTLTMRNPLLSEKTKEGSLFIGMRICYVMDGKDKLFTDSTISARRWITRKSNAEQRADGPKMSLQKKLLI